MASTPEGSEIAYVAEPCGVGTAVVGVINLATGRARRWSIGRYARPDDVSLSADGRTIAFTYEMLKRPAPRRASRTKGVSFADAGTAVRVLSSAAPPGPVGQRGHTLVPSPGMGARTHVTSAYLSFPAAELIVSAVVGPVGSDGFRGGVVSEYDMRGQRVHQVCAWDHRVRGIDIVAGDTSGRYLLVTDGVALERVDVTARRCRRLPAAGYLRGLVNAAW